MADPYLSLVTSLSEKIKQYTQNALSGLSTELGTMTASGLKLDGFKHELKSYLVIDFPVTIELPSFHLVGTCVTPVDHEGYPLSIPGPRTRFEFEKTKIEGVRINLAEGLQPGDRVAVVNINNGHDVIVIGKVVSQHG